MDKQEHNQIQQTIGENHFVQVVKNRAYHEGIKCTSYEAMFGQPMKVGLKTSTLPGEAIDDVRTEEELKEIIDSIEHGHLPIENEAAEDAERSSGSRDKVAGGVEYEEGQEEIQEMSESETEEELADTPMTEMDDEPTLFPSIYKRRERINEKRKMTKTNLEAQTFKMTRLAREKFPPRRDGNTVKVRVPDVDRGRCDSRNILGVITEVDPIKICTRSVQKLVC